MKKMVLELLLAGLVGCAGSETALPEKQPSEAPQPALLYEKAIKLKKEALAAIDNTERMELAEQSLDAFIAAERAEPNDANGLYEYADLMRRTRNFQHAAALYDRVIALDAKHHQARHDRASCHYLFGELAEAKEQLDSAIELAEEPHYFVTRGAVHFRLGQSLNKDSFFTDAISDYEKAIRLDSKNPDYQVSLGRVLYFLGQRTNDEKLLKKAFGAYSKALGLKPFKAHAEQDVIKERQQIMKQLGIEEY